MGRQPSEARDFSPRHRQRSCRGGGIGARRVPSSCRDQCVGRAGGRDAIAAPNPFLQQAPLPDGVPTDLLPGERAFHWVTEKAKNMGASTVYPEPLAMILSAAGWSPDRRVDKKELEGILIARGFPMHEALKPFIENLNGLRVQAFANDWLSFDIEFAALSYSAKSLAFLGSITKGPLCPLGQYSRSAFFGNAKGEIFGLDVDWLMVLRAPTLLDFMSGVLLRDEAKLEAIILQDDQKPEHMR